MSRRDAVVAVILALVLAGRAYHSLTQKSATFDEWMHLENGLSFCEGARFPLDLTDLINPPLGRMLAACGIGRRTWEDAPLPAPAPSCRALQKWRERTAGFPFRYEVDSVGLLRLGRLPVLLFSLLGIPLLVALAREVGYPRAGLWAAGVYALCPNLVAHARLITPDLPVSVLCLATLLAWLRLQLRPCLGRAVTAGVVLGAALATKYSAVLLGPILAAAPIVASAGGRRRAFVMSCAAGLVATVFVLVLYAVVVVPHVTVSAVAAAEHGEEIARFLPRAQGMLGRYLVLPAVLYRYGLVVAGKAVMKSFLIGHHRFGGWWSYFPIAMAIKTPLCELLCLSIGLGWAFRRRAWNAPLVWLAAFPATYLGITMAKGIQVGLRHVLPVYPLMALATGCMLSAWWKAGGVRRWAAGLLIVGVAAEGLAIHPHYLAFFNLGAGGPDKGHHYLVDCNLDWGQDLPALARFQRRELTGPLTLAYFGSDLPERWGIEHRIMCEPPGAARPSPGVYAVSATIREGLYSYPDRLHEMAWFRAHPPTALVAHTILIYDLREGRESVSGADSRPVRRAPPSHRAR